MGNEEFRQACNDLWRVIKNYYVIAGLFSAIYAIALHDNVAAYFRQEKSLTVSWATIISDLTALLDHPVARVIYGLAALWMLGKGARQVILARRHTHAEKLASDAALQERSIASQREMLELPVMIAFTETYNRELAYVKDLIDRECRLRRLEIQQKRDYWQEAQKKATNDWPQFWPMKLDTSTLRNIRICLECQPMNNMPPVVTTEMEQIRLLQVYDPDANATFLASFENDVAKVDEYIKALGQALEKAEGRAERLKSELEQRLAVYGKQLPAPGEI